MKNLTMILSVASLGLANALAVSPAFAELAAAPKCASSCAACTATAKTARGSDATPPSRPLWQRPETQLPTTGK